MGYPAQNSIVLFEGSTKSVESANGKEIYHYILVPEDGWDLQMSLYLGRRHRATGKENCVPRPAGGSTLESCQG